MEPTPATAAPSEPGTGEPTLSDLIAIWQAALTTLVELSRNLTPEQWATPTQCPGWSVGDIVAHTADIEAYAGGEDRPEVDLDWDALPHVLSEVGMFTEAGVSVRRGTPQAVVIDELESRIALRRDQLDALADGAEVTGLMGTPVPVERFLRVRIFDIWAHEQDIRTAIGSDGGWNSDAAGIAFVQMLGGLPYVWGKSVGAPAGATLQLSIIGPALHHVACVVVDESGKGRRCEPMEEPTVKADMTWAAYMKLSCGRVSPDDAWLADKVELSGDPDLGARLLAGMAVTP